MSSKSYYIHVYPDTLELEPGEFKQFTIDTNLPTFDIESHLNDAGVLDLKHYEIKGNSVGYGYVKFYYILQDTEEEVSAYLNVRVRTIDDFNGIRYMIHNKQLDRLVTVTSDKTNEEHLTFNLPGKNGLLASNISMESDINTAIMKPSIIYPLDGSPEAKAFKGIIRTSPFQTTTMYEGLKHTHTEWQISEDRFFNNIIEQEKRQGTQIDFYNQPYRNATDSNNLLLYGTKYAGRELYYRVRYYGGDDENTSVTYLSDWSEPVMIYGVDWGVVGGEKILSGDVNAGYMGEIPRSELVERDYRGPYFWLTRYGMNTFYAGETVSFGHRLWKCVKNTVNETGNGKWVPEIPGDDKLDYNVPFIMIKEFKYHVVVGETHDYQFVIGNIKPGVKLKLEWSYWQHPSHGRNDSPTFTWNEETTTATGVYNNNFMYEIPANTNVYYYAHFYFINEEKPEEPDIYVRFRIYVWGVGTNRAEIKGRTKIQQAPDMQTISAFNIANNLNFTIPWGRPMNEVFQVRFDYCNHYRNRKVGYEPDFFWESNTQRSMYSQSISGTNIVCYASRNGTSALQVVNIGSRTDTGTYDTSTMFTVRTYGRPKTWEEDTRENLPPMRWFVDRIGIGMGLTDYNNDGYSFNNTALGPLVNAEEGWLKFIHKGKILYVAKKPLCKQLAFNDVAKRNAANGERTLRIGSRQYRVRMLSEEEYMDLFLTSETTYDPDYNAGSPYKFPYNKENVVIFNLNKYELSYVINGARSGELLQDFRNGSKRKVMYITEIDEGRMDLLLEELANEPNVVSFKQIHSNVVCYIKDEDTKDRRFVYRPVLELVTEGNESFFQLADCVKAYDNNGYELKKDKIEILQYDYFMDCGYFGAIPGDKFPPYYRIYSESKLTGGNNTEVTGWLKFLHDGMIKLVSKSYVRMGTSIAWLNEPNIRYSADMGDGKQNIVSDQNSNIYSLYSLEGTRWVPVIKAAEQLNNEPGRYSFNCDCLIRKFNPIDLGNLSYSNQSDNLKALRYQIGEPFGDMGVRENASGYKWLEIMEPPSINEFYYPSSESHFNATGAYNDKWYTTCHSQNARGQKIQYNMNSYPNGDIDDCMYFMLTPISYLYPNFDIYNKNIIKCD